MRAPIQILGTMIVCVVLPYPHRPCRQQWWWSPCHIHSGSLLADSDSGRFHTGCRSLRTHRYLQSHTHTESVSTKYIRGSFKGLKCGLRNWFCMCDLSKRIHLQRIRPCTRIDKSPWCWDSQHCCCTCVSHLSIHPGLKHNKRLHSCKRNRIHPNIEDKPCSIKSISK